MNHIKHIITIAFSLTAVWAGGGHLAAQTMDASETDTYSKGLYKTPKAPPTIQIDYQKLTKTYACAGDTILVTATADGITDVILPKDKYWSGDANGAIVEKTATSITKRFYTYHPYKETNPTAEKSADFDFVIVQGGTQTTVRHAVVAKSCPPTINPPELKSSTVGQKYNLGYIAFEFSFPNQTTREDRTQFAPVITPPQAVRLFLERRSNTTNQLEIRYRSIPTSDAKYDLKIRFNEGDSLRTASFGPYRFDVTSLNEITADQSAYCSGEDIHFTLTLPDEYEKMLLQKTGPNPGLDKISQCFNWNGSPSEVEFKGWDQNTHTYRFSTKAAGPSDRYHCRMSVDLKYQSSANKPVIDTTIHVDYDLPIKSFAVHSAEALTTDAIDGCEGSKIDLSDYLQAGTGMTVEGYTSGTSFTGGTQYTVPGQSETIQVKIKSNNFQCSFMEPDGTFPSPLTVNVKPQPRITQPVPGITSGICEREILTVTATASPADAKVTWSVDNKPEYKDIPSGQSVQFVLSKTATLSVTATNQCGTTAPLNYTVSVTKAPTVTFDKQSPIQQCPGTPVTLSGTDDGDRHEFQLRDLNSGQSVTPPGFSTDRGLDNYQMPAGANLELIYTAYKGTCATSATARIKAHPLPDVTITYDGQNYGDGNYVICVPRDVPFSLGASGADTYTWSKDGNGVATPAFTLGDDADITVRGTVAATTCYKEIAVQCIVSVEHVNRVKSEAVCPYDNVCFRADDLPNTTYAWFGPQGTDLTHKTEQFCFNPTTEPGQTGIYTLKTERHGCKEELRYELALHPYPRLNTIVNHPVCEGDELVFNYQHGLSRADIQRAVLTDGTGTEVPGQTITADRIIYRIPDIPASAAGRYTLTVTTDQGCTARDETDITVGTHLTPVFSIAPAYCEDDEETLTTATTGAGYTYRWSTDNRVISADETQPTVPTVWLRDDNGSLHLDINQNGCTDRTSQPLTVIPRPHLSGLPQDTGICFGTSLCLVAHTDYAPQQVVWYFIGADGRLVQLPQAGNQPLMHCLEQADPAMEGRYFVMASNKNCESSSDTVRFTVHPLPDIRIEGPTFICDGDTVTLTAVSQTPGSNRWSPAGQTTETIAVTKAGRYGVTRTSPHGCRDSAETSLEARPLPYFSLPPDTSICRGTSFMIYGPEGMDAYLWNDGSEEKDRLAEDGGWYILTAFRNECPFSDSLYVHESFCGQFHFPTAFTPNDNRVNDTWGAISAAKDEDMAEYDLMVFDRNGKKVFHGKRITDQWDGKYKGQLCPPGVYTFSFRALEKEEGIKYRSSGTVTIVL